LNETAAHYCPEDEDEIVFEDQLCCLDVGVHVNGFIGDNALSVDLGENKDLVKASLEGLKAAQEIIGVGVKLGEIGKAIEDAIKSFGFEPVRNLSGHGLSEYNIHDRPTIPNFDNKDESVLEKGMTIAIEPFATNGSGMIHEKGNVSVFVVNSKPKARIGFVRDIANKISKYNGLPFTTRWLTKDFSAARVKYALNQFKLLGCLKEYPPLVERGSGLVSQAEKSFYIDDEVVCLTNP